MSLTHPSSSSSCWAVGEAKHRHRGGGCTSLDGSAALAQTAAALKTAAALEELTRGLLPWGLGLPAGVPSRVGTLELLRTATAAEELAHTARVAAIAVWVAGQACIAGIADAAEEAADTALQVVDTAEVAGTAAEVAETAAEVADTAAEVAVAL